MFITAHRLLFFGSSGDIHISWTYVCNENPTREGSKANIVTIFVLNYKTSWKSEH